MLIEDFIITVYCLVDDIFKKATKGSRIRQKGPAPKLSDPEVITMEIVGEFMFLDQDKKIHAYFKTHWNELFPNIGDRSTFVTQSKNLWAYKQEMQKICVEKLLLDGDQELRIIDGFPMPICNFRRAHFSKIFKGDAAFGHCAAKNQTYYGFKGHLLTDENGVIIDILISPANYDEREAMLDMGEKIPKHLLGDKGYICNDIKKEHLNQMKIELHTPLRSNMKDPRDPKKVRKINSVRRIIETVIGQLTERFHIEKVRARNLWSLTNRITRKILACNLCRLIARSLGKFDLKLENLVTM